VIPSPLVHLAALPPVRVGRPPRFGPASPAGPVFAPATTIRWAGPSDQPALAALAVLDAARPLAGDVLVAEQAGGLIAALAVRDRRAIADPFIPSREIVRLLELRADQLTRAAAPTRRRFRLRPARARLRPR
jgi:hypothetical protein